MKLRYAVDSTLCERIVVSLNTALSPVTIALDGTVINTARNKKELKGNPVTFTLPEGGVICVTAPHRVSLNGVALPANPGRRLLAARIAIWAAVLMAASSVWVVVETGVAPGFLSCAVCADTSNVATLTLIALSGIFLIGAGLLFAREPVPACVIGIVTLCADVAVLIYRFAMLVNVGEITSLILIVFVVNCAMIFALALGFQAARGVDNLKGMSGA